MDRNWILNDWIGHHKHGFIPINQPHFTLNLSFRRRPGGPSAPIRRLPVDMPTLVSQDLARQDSYNGKPGYRLRVVYEPRDNNIYIQRNQSSPRKLIASVPSGV